MDYYNLFGLLLGISIWFRSCSGLKAEMNPFSFLYNNNLKPLSGRIPYMASWTPPKLAVCWRRSSGTLYNVPTCDLKSIKRPIIASQQCNSEGLCQNDSMTQSISGVVEKLWKIRIIMPLGCILYWATWQNGVQKNKKQAMKQTNQLWWGEF